MNLSRLSSILNVIRDEVIMLFREEIKMYEKYSQ